MCTYKISNESSWLDSASIVVRKTFQHIEKLVNSDATIMENW